MKVSVTVGKKQAHKVEVNLVRNQNSRNPAVIPIPVKAVKANINICAFLEATAPQSDNVQTDADIELHDIEIVPAQDSAAGFPLSVQADNDPFTDYESLSEVEGLSVNDQPEATNESLEEISDSIERLLDGTTAVSASETDAEYDSSNIEADEAVIHSELDELIDMLEDDINEAEAEEQSHALTYDRDDDVIKPSVSMRYVSRGASGDKVEVDDRNALGRELICFDEKSGKLSRICGFIKKGRSNSSND